VEGRAGGFRVVRRLFALAGLAVFAAAVWGEDPAPDASLVLFGDGGGRVWSWAGAKTYLTPAGETYTLGGLRGKTLWGWRTDSGRARFFSMSLPAKKGATAGRPVLDKASFPIPELADRVGDRLLLVYNAQTGPRWEVWQNGTLVAAKAYEDRTVYAVALGPRDGWLVVGATKDGAPWLNVSGTDIEGPEGWRGRLTVAVWFGDGKTPYTPLAAGWGSSGKAPQVLFWESSGWTQPAPEEAPADPKKPALSPTPSPTPALEAAVYPVVGLIGKSGLTLGGWQTSGGINRPWFWDGKEDVSESPADGEIQALSLGKGKTLVVKHRSAPWFTFEDGKTSQPIALDEDDRVVAVDAGKAD
jgi:hypothetical protein